MSETATARTAASGLHGWRPRVGAVLALYALGGGIVSLVGWALDVPGLADWGGNGIHIQPNACVAAALSAGALLLLLGEKRRAAAAAGLLSGLIAAAALFQYATGASLEGVNTLLMFGRTWGRAGVIDPGRMGPAGATCWALLGVAFLAASAGQSPRLRRLAPRLALATLGLAALSITGYLYGASTLYSLPHSTVIALQTATFIAAVAVGVLAASPGEVPLNWLLDAGTTGKVARRAALVVVLVPLVLGWLSVRGEALGLYDSRFGAATYVVAVIALLLIVVSSSFATIRRHETALEADFAALARLQGVSTRLIRSGDMSFVLGEILAAAVDLTRAAKGNIQFYDGDGTLRIAVHQGHGPEFLAHFAEDGGTAVTGAATRRRERFVVEDVSSAAALRETETAGVLLRDGILAVQSTPLLSRDGRVLGVLSTHFGAVSRPGERELRYVDLLARMAADVIERVRNEAELRDADRRKDEFLATLAHELRGPLAPLRYALELLERAGRDESLAARARATMRRQIAHMVRLLDDLLDVARITRDKLELRRERVPLGRIVEEAAEGCAALVKERRHEFSVSLPAEPVLLDADPTRLVQAVGNLLHNACRYTRPGGRISLSAERADGQAVVRVRDDGVGISPGQLPNVFDPFSRLSEHATPDQGGLGIGLNLVKRLVEMHGGAVEARSEGPDRGCEFVLRLPALPAEAPPEAPAVSARPRGPLARRCLVVDDDPDSVSALAELLAESGCEVRTASDGASAVALAAEFRPDTVMLDVGLPGVSGLEACRRIREQPWGRDMLLVALTGFGQKEDRLKSEAAGFDHHLVKPVDFNALLVLLSGAERRAGLGTKSPAPAANMVR